MESENEPSLYRLYNYHLIYYSIMYIIGEVLLEFLFGKPLQTTENKNERTVFVIEYKYRSLYFMSLTF